MNSSVGSSQLTPVLDYQITEMSFKQKCVMAVRSAASFRVVCIHFSSRATIRA